MKCKIQNVIKKSLAFLHFVYMMETNKLELDSTCKRENMTLRNE